jgi:hypothetical protein
MKGILKALINFSQRTSDEIINKILFNSRSASGEYRGVDSGLNNKVALKFSPLGVVEIFLSIYAINFNHCQENKIKQLASMDI